MDTVTSAVNHLRVHFDAYALGKIKLRTVLGAVSEVVLDYPQVCVGIVGHYPIGIYNSHQLAAFDGSDPESPKDSKSQPIFQLSSLDDVKKVFEILRNKSYNNAIVGPDITGYNVGYRLLYFRKFGYEGVYKRLYPKLYEKDAKVIEDYDLQI